MTPMEKPSGSDPIHDSRGTGKDRVQGTPQGHEHRCGRPIVGEEAGRVPVEGEGGCGEEAG
eukprot:CAMPEP_0174309606 /NCGR_PEP_ID=MMETSP0810-20121108/2520_1 /TAXON_ID=73025 ORGANISM="Eutreptiella gymnastica-like, Strain CCMP1594" /NCGR_SAMPLE_ID=MMETSP0810 /ASSEMBLY_ACC=CAM_ASM_000659 /LENGTH=60 /DNA_ID=CAMNT_0015417291 /DNA_START=481 /DNA_END=659 /DNA_ORIENTATION=+